ncbi:MAG TPA: hypothetical protein VJC03_04975, partial [bacterium]|nr:hypothetical protein [bacterium]
MRVINIGLESFYDTLTEQGADALKVPFYPSPLIREIKQLYRRYEKISEANRKAAGILVGGHPLLADVKQAGEVIPELRGDLLLHAGPPI